MAVFATFSFLKGTPFHDFHNSWTNLNYYQQYIWVPFSPVFSPTLVLFSFLMIAILDEIEYQCSFDLHFPDD
jgi:hypothetical protein